ncbi:Hypothetical predicted protein [Paramuricea clavata]|uniref:Uncharacterized protein n=1 Tax=Paramuricea clavata TaxID=317549 RepID=A0A7D9HTB7_PARCT|nr:Hypothetical predicted protein [Paramuricea clavata]
MTYLDSDEDAENEGTVGKNVEPKKSNATGTTPADQSCKSESHTVKSLGTYPTCWSVDQYNYLITTYSWLIFENGSIGCSICRKIKSLGVGTFTTKSSHISTEWSACSVRRDGKKAVAQKALRKKIQKHAKSQAHIAASGILDEKEEEKVETALLKSVAHSRELTERCLRTAYFIGYQNRPFTDYPDILALQSRNGIELGSILHSSYTLTEMIECIATNMRKKHCSAIRDNERKIAIIIDESTFVSCLIIYTRAVIVETPENVFLDMRELEGQDAESVFKCLLTMLAEFGFDEDYTFGVWIWIWIIHLEFRVWI